MATEREIEAAAHALAIRRNKTVPVSLVSWSQNDFDDASAALEAAERERYRVLSAQFQYSTTDRAKAALEAGKEQ